MLSFNVKTEEFQMRLPWAIVAGDDKETVDKAISAARLPRTIIYYTCIGMYIF